MSIAQVKRHIAKIKELAGDDESAHCEEDKPHCAVLQSIASGTAEDPKLMAALALTTKEIEFSRWCA